MDRMEKLIRGLLDPEAAAPDAKTAAELASRMTDPARPADEAPESIVELAARLNGGLDDEARDRLDTTVAAFGQDYQDLAASAELIDRVAANLSAAPADLLAQAVGPKPVLLKRTTRNPLSWLWIGGAVLAAAFAAVLVLHRLPPPATDNKMPMMAAPDQTEPKGAEKPRMMPTGSSDTVPAGK